MSRQAGGKMIMIQELSLYFNTSQEKQLQTPFFPLPPAKKNRYSARKIVTKLVCMGNFIT